MTDFQALASANAPYGAFVEFDSGANGGAGPLGGVTLGVKANIMVKGLAWTAGMELYRTRRAHRDAAAVALLRAAGAEVLGTLNMHEAALGAHGDNPFYGTCHNPRRAGFSPGGSSSGSAAAVAAGLCDLALGTDTLGSIRIPAAYCGVYGLKPTHGAVSQDGLACLEPEFDCIGPLARSLDLIERCWAVLSPASPPPPPVPLRRMLVLDGLGAVTCEPAVLSAYEAALAQARLPRETLALADDAAAIRRAGLARAGQWLLRDMGPLYRSDSPHFSEELHFILGACARMAPQGEVLERTRTALHTALGDDGVLILPTAPQPAFAHGTRPPANQADFTALASVAGLPALSIPAGCEAGGLPVGVQLVGPMGSENALIALARQIEAKGD
ncbi:amidase [Novosphingobium sp.]|uniref:amidase family protein n=1 Tax=Novosphingobium sp. TaxID=1874826 RepID=UPI001EB3A4E7|nr:amidase [Novosphingobium sp.]MBK9009333.1 amidase [Novosphingobium sp.]